MTSVTNLVKLLKTLKYFNHNLRLLKDKVDLIEVGEVSKQKRLNREAEVVNKYLAIHYYKNLSEKAGITPEEFKFLITRKSTDYKVFIARLQKYFPVMSQEEFDIYIEVYNKLQNDV